MSEKHPVLAELLSLCKIHGVSEEKAYLAFDLYNELNDFLLLWDVEYHFNEELKAFYVTAKVRADTEKFKVYVPIVVDKSLTMEYLQLLQEKLSTEDKLIILSFKDTESSSAHYRVSKGLALPEALVTSEENEMDYGNGWKYQRFLKKWKDMYKRAIELEGSEK